MILYVILIVKFSPLYILHLIPEYTIAGVWCSADATAVSRWATPLHQQFCHLFAYSLFSPLCTFAGTKIQNGIVESFKLAYFYMAAL
jgi:hypothetical protein